MAFNDYPYYVLLLALVSITLFLRVERRWVLLLGFSLLFYSYGRWAYIFLLLASIGIDYVCGLWIGSSTKKSARVAGLAVSLLTNLSLLIFFKYMDALYANWGGLETRASAASAGAADILLPLGLSFYTLQSMGYTIDVYRKRIQPEKHLGYFALYVSFFPQLVAGPIERPWRLLPQLRKPSPLTLKDIEEGIFLIVFGLMKKLIIADRLFALIRDWGAAPEAIFGWQALTFGIVAFWAVYLDISAYTDIARGSAKLFGVDLMENFNRPFLARSQGDFWRRWHISLTGWIMDYVFRPLAKLSRTQWQRHLALILTFLIIGLWHGPTLPYLLMGGLNGGVIVLERIAARRRFVWPEGRCFSLLRTLRVYLIINLSGVLFVSSTMSQAGTILQQIFISDSFWGPASFSDQLYSTGFVAITLMGAAMLMLVSAAGGPARVCTLLRSTPAYFRAAILYVALFGVVAFSERSTHDFLYFIF